MTAALNSTTIPSNDQSVVSSSVARTRCLPDPTAVPNTGLPSRPWSRLASSTTSIRSPISPTSSPRSSTVLPTATSPSYCPRPTALNPSKPWRENDAYSLSACCLVPFWPVGECGPKQVDEGADCILG